MEVIESSLASFGAKRNASLITFDNGHLDLISEIAEVGSLGKARCKIAFLWHAGVIDSSCKGATTTTWDIRDVPIVVLAVILQWVVNYRISISYCRSVDCSSGIPWGDFRRIS